MSHTKHGHSQRSLCRIRRFLSALVPAVTLTSAAALYGQGHQQVIVQSGQVPPEGNGVLDVFHAASISDVGEVAFTGSLSGTSGGLDDDDGIYRHTANGLSTVAREGAASPNGGTLFFSPFTRPPINNLGQIAFADEREAVYRSTGSQLTPLATSRDASPSPPGLFLEFGPPLINQAGQVAFFADVIGGSDGIFRHDDSAGLQTIALRGQAEPGGNGTFSCLGYLVTGLPGGGTLCGDAALGITSAGQVAFRAKLSNTTTGTDSGIYLGSPGGLTQLAREGQVTPSGNGAFADLASATILSVKHPVATSAAGGAAWIANVFGSTNGTNVGVFRGDGTQSTEIARNFQSAPDGNGVISNFITGSGGTSSSEFLSATSSGRVFFTVQLASTAGGFLDDEGVFSGSGGPLTQVFRESQAAPGGDGRLRHFGSHRQFRAPTEGTHVAMVASIDESIGGELDNVGIFLSDGIDVVEVVREASIPGSNGTNASVQLHGTNDRGQVVYSTAVNSANALYLWTPDLHWRAPGNGNWQTGANWTLGIRPDVVHDVTIDPAVNVRVGGLATSAVRSLQIGGGLGRAELVLDPNDELATTNGLRIAENGVLTAQGTIHGPVENSSLGLISVDQGNSLLISGNLIQNGVLQILGDASPAFVSVLGDFSGVGGFHGAGNLALQGGFRPGNSTASIRGEGNLFLEVSSTTEIELAGLLENEFDQLVLDGDLDIRGNLTAVTLHGYLPKPGDSFLVLDVQGERSGEFQGLPERAVVTQIGLRQISVSYRAGDGNDVELFTTSLADFDGDNRLECRDVDALVQEIAAGRNSAPFDLNGDLRVNEDDLARWLQEAGSVNLPSGNPYLWGDANLDGVVDGSDFNRWNSNKFTSVAAWCQGDFNADGQVDGSDFGIWNSRKFTSSNVVSAVPEPGMAWVMVGTGLGILLRRGWRGSPAPARVLHRRR